MVVLFSGTWVWAAHLVAAIRDYAASGKAMLLWTHPGSQGWRPVGGFVMHGGLLEIGVPHKFVYGEAADPDTILKITSYARAAHLEEFPEHVYSGDVWRSRHGANLRRCRSVAVDAHVWRRYRFARYYRTHPRCGEISPKEISDLQPRLKKLFGAAPEKNLVNEHSIRLYLALKKIVAKREI